MTSSRTSGVFAPAPLQVPEARETLGGVLAVQLLGEAVHRRGETLPVIRLPRVSPLLGPQPPVAPDPLDRDPAHVDRADPQRDARQRRHDVNPHHHGVIMREKAPSLD
ncbi:hypothetical protein GCM10027598_37070 [Amycolatopsis oliviviridis]|uniref:Uncharacterized protein n=1 Tax=Amycolatopsis oliviviridis TaxID=1471590 RepID=A0ABQ3LDQ8_9PSEU|nr:hypothetical protein GCM10017790_24760 [Amycolatopsis oliviviridis]